jgi:hypothetical protein
MYTFEHIDTLSYLKRQQSGDSDLGDVKILNIFIVRKLVDFLNKIKKTI